MAGDGHPVTWCCAPCCAHPGGAISEHQKLLAEAGMIIRDPPAMHLLLSELVRQLHRCVAGAQLPRDNPQVGGGTAGITSAQYHVLQLPAICDCRAAANAHIIQ